LSDSLRIDPMALLDPDVPVDLKAIYQSHLG
jgi:hypothetical protein